VSYPGLETRDLALLVEAKLTISIAYLPSWQFCSCLPSIWARFHLFIINYCLAAVLGYTWTYLQANRVKSVQD